MEDGDPGYCADACEGNGLIFQGMDRLDRIGIALIFHRDFNDLRKVAINMC